MSIVKSLSVDNGDMFYINHNSDNFTIIDCNIKGDKKDEIIKEIKKIKEKKNITRFISTHPDEDHILGIKDLDNAINIVNFYLVDNDATKKDESDSFKHYQKLKKSDYSYFIEKGCTRKWMNKEDETRGSSGISIYWPIRSNEHFKDELKKANNGESPNNISPIIRYSIDKSGSFLWMGDLETEFMEKIEEHLDLPNTKILFAPHHGRESGKVPKKILDKMSPKIIIIGEAPSGQINYYNGYKTITQNRAGNITFKCNSGYIDIYVSNENYAVDFLKNRNLPSSDVEFYIGSLSTN